VRTTLDIADDVLAAARALAASENRSLGQVVSGLARRGLASTSRVVAGALPTFAVPDDATPLTVEMVQRALDE